MQNTFSLESQPLAQSYIIKKNPSGSQFLLEKGKGWFVHPVPQLFQGMPSYRTDFCLASLGALTGMQQSACLGQQKWLF
jgi:hypothetical protein